MSHPAFKRGRKARDEGLSNIAPPTEDNPNQWLKGWGSKDKPKGEWPFRGGSQPGRKYNRGAVPGDTMPTQSPAASAGNPPSQPSLPPAEKTAAKAAAQPAVGNAPPRAIGATRDDVSEAADAAGFPSSGAMGPGQVGGGGVCYRHATQGIQCAANERDGKRCLGASFVPLSRSVADDTAKGLLEMFAGATAFFADVPMEDERTRAHLAPREYEWRGVGSSFHAMSVAYGWPGPLSAGLMHGGGALVSFMVRAGAVVKKRRAGNQGGGYETNEERRAREEFEAWKRETQIEAQSNGATAPPKTSQKKDPDEGREDPV